MIELLSGFPDGIVAAVAKGHLRKSDYDTVLVPAVEAAFERRPKVRVYYEIGHDFASVDAGAIWADFRVGIGHLTGWERIAVVTDIEWIRQAINVMRLFVPGDVRAFSTAEAAAARRWIVDGLR